MGTLNAFVDRPELRQAFADHALGLDDRAWQGQAASRVCMASWMGQAFQYLVRFEVGRWSVVHRVEAVATSWVARLGLHNLTQFSHLASQAPRWTRFIDGAEQRIQAYYTGQEVSVQERIQIALLLAQLDPLYRRPQQAAAHLRQPSPPTPVMRARLEGWLEQFLASWEHVPPPASRVLINPEYHWVPAVGGADADLVIDDTLISLDVAARPGTPTQLRRLAGHAALSHLAGFYLPGQEHLTAPVRAIGLYGARESAPQWHQIPLAELFPGSHWEKYLRAFKACAQA